MEPNLIAGARKVLEVNRTGDSTKPSPNLYPHQWNWDSCFIAIGCSHYDPERAQLELRSLLKGQWSNGMVPQIVFNRDTSGYFPGPDTWRSNTSPYAPKDVSTSGITQPPMLATAALAAWRHDSDRNRADGFACEVFPRIRAYHEFLYRERDVEGRGLIVVVHPWESGLDNSPPYLDAGSRVHLTYRPQYTRLDTRQVAAANRPSDKDYDLFVWLLEQMRDVQYDWDRYLPTAALQVEDVLFNTILCQANTDLAELAEAAGEDGRPCEEWRARTQAAIEQKLWNEESDLYLSFDRVSDRLLKQPTIVSLSPLYGIQLNQDRQAELVAALTDPARFWPAHGYPCPSTGLASSWFNPENYWRGPVWVNTNWLLIRGLQRHGLAGEAEKLSSATLELVRQSGFREYYNPFTGKGYGTNQFSWTAALTIDLLAEPVSGQLIDRTPDR